MEVCPYILSELAARAAKTPLFKDIPVSTIGEILSRLNVCVRRFRRGEILVHEDMPFRWAFLPLEGRLKLYECGFRASDRHLIGTASDGGLVGVEEIMSEGTNHFATVVAAEVTECLCLELKALRKLVLSGDFLVVAARLFSALGRNVRAAYRKLAVVSQYKIAARIELYERFSRSGILQADIHTRAELAEYLGVNYTAIFRATEKRETAKSLASARDCRCAVW